VDINAIALWAAQQGMNLQSSTPKEDETGEPFHVHQAKQIRRYRKAWKEAGMPAGPRISVPGSAFPLVDDRSRAGLAIVRVSD
jgi:hypothetical protein